MKRRLILLLFAVLFSSSAFGQTNCAEIQTRFNGVSVLPGLSYAGDTWADVQKRFGSPTQTRQANGQVSAFVYIFDGCSADFVINSEGKISSKNFKLGTI